MIAAIGDIHGVLAPLDRLLDRLAGLPVRRVIFVGDYIDRGGEDRLVIDRLLQFARDVDCIFLRGNHDDRAISILRGEGRYTRPERWAMYGGEEAIESLAGRPVADILDVASYIDDIPQRCLDFLYGLNRLWHVEAGHVFVHAGLRDMQAPLEDQDDIPAEDTPLSHDAMHAIHYGTLWTRGEFFACTEPSPHGVVVHGHTPVRSLPRYGLAPDDYSTPFFRRNDCGELLSIDVDTGCVYGFSLSALLIDNGEYETLSESSSGL